MKSHTDLAQSQILAKILPPESADMYYFRQIDSDYFPPNVESILPIPLFKNGKEDFNYDIPCWSASALLESIRNNGRYELQMYEGGYYFEANGFMTESYFNTVDACVEMILKLKERDLL